MRRDITGSSQKSTLRLVLGGKEESGNALSPFGPVRAGLTTSQRTNRDLALLVLLNSLERKIEDLNTKSLEVLNTFLTDTDHPVKHISFSSTATITRDVVE
jgi:hypothetical protein